MGIGTEFYVSIPKGFEHLPAEQVSQTAPGRGRIDPFGNAFVGEALLWLPAGETHSATKAASNGSSKLVKHILLADDNAEMRQYIVNVLRLSSRSNR